MGILVHFKNNTACFVPNNELDELIASGDIIAFKRESGWVEIGKDPIRGDSGAGDFKGPDRRGAKSKMSCLTCFDFIDSMYNMSAIPPQGEGTGLAGHGQGTSAGVLMKQADEAMSKAKSQGKNKVIRYGID